MRTLISVTELQDLLAGPSGVLILDCRYDLARPSAGEQAFALAHVRGARYADLGQDLSGSAGPTGGGRHPLPSIQQWRTRLARWSVGPATRVVAYDDTGGCFAARAWWLFRYFGHSEVAVLDGGWQAWLAAGADVDGGSVAPGIPASAPPRSPPAVNPDRSRDELAATAVASPPPTLDEASADRSYPSSVGIAAVPVVTIDGLVGRLLVDARDPARYAGEMEPIDPRAGHIPGARNRFWKSNLDANGHFLPIDELRSHWLGLLGGVPVGQVVCYCGSGVTACHNILALAHCGIGEAHLYPGSWSEYSSDPARTVALGPEPGPSLMTG